MGTVLMVDGFGYDGFLPQTATVKALVAQGHTAVQFTYDNKRPSDAGITAAATALAERVAALPKPVHVVTVSMGGQVASMLLRRWGGSAGPVPPSQVTFTLLANPERKYNGAVTLRARVGSLPSFVRGYTDLSVVPAGPLSVGIPADTPYTVTDVARQYDGVTDWPDDASKWDAVMNAAAGIVSVHSNYFSVHADDAANLRKVEGNVTYVLCPTYPLPILSATAWMTDYTRDQDRARRPKVEAAYRRPFVVRSATSTRPAAIASPNLVTDPISLWKQVDTRRRVLDAEAREQPLLRLFDKRMRYVGTVRTEKSLDVEQLMHDSGTGEVVLRGTDWLINFLRTDVRAEEDLNFAVDPYPRRRSWRWRLGFKVTNVKVGRGEDGLTTVTLQLISNREHWKHLLFGATPAMPPEAQPIKCWLHPGNTRTVIATGGFVNLARLFFPPLSIFTNVLNPGAWVGATNVLNVWPLNWPIQMQFVNPLIDQSRLTVLMSRWQNAHDVTESMLRDAGCHVRDYLWLEEDEDSPHPELAALVGETLARPTRNCIVLAVEDSSGVTGPTGTFLDGAINLIAASADDLITNTLIPEYDVNGDGVTDPLIRRWFGVAPKVPDLVFRDGDGSAIISSEHSMYKAKAKHIHTGGRSPQYVNQIQTFFIRYGISKIAEAIAVFGQIPGTEGLENVYQGQADDVLLAFMRYTDPNRELTAGEYGFLEEAVQGSGSAYTISSPLTLREGHYKTRAYHAFKVQVRNNRPHRAYLDFDIGTRALFEIDGILSTDQVTALRLHYDESTPKTIDVSIGDDSEAESPLAQVTRTAQQFWAGLGMLFGQESVF